MHAAEFQIPRQVPPECQLPRRLSAKSLDNTKILDATVSEVMDGPFPVVEVSQPVDAIAKLLSKSNPAVLVRENGAVRGIVTRSDMLNYLMAR